MFPFHYNLSVPTPLQYICSLHCTTIYVPILYVTISIYHFSLQFILIPTPLQYLFPMSYNICSSHSSTISVPIPLQYLFLLLYNICSNFATIPFPTPLQYMFALHYTVPTSLQYLFPLHYNICSPLKYDTISHSTTISVPTPL